MKKFVSILLSVIILSTMISLAVPANAVSSDKYFAGEESIEPTSEASQETTAEETTEPTSDVTTPTQSPTQETTEPVITPSAPKNFRVTSTSTDFIILKWDKVSEATSYVISRADEKSDGTIGNYKEIKTIDTNAVTSYKNTADIKAGKLYKYKIVAVRKASVTTKSSAQTLKAMTNPDNVKTLKVSAKTTDSMTIKWSKNSSASKYIILRSDEKSNGKFTNYSSINAASKSKTTFTDKGLKAGYFYKYKVCVQKTKSGVTATSSGKTVKNATKLASPKKVVNKKSTTTKIKIAWSKVAKASKYEVYRKTANTKYKKVATTSSTSYIDTKVTTGTNYKYKVRAFRTSGGKKYYGVFNSIKTATSVNAVTGLTIKSYLKRGLLSWKAVDGASGYEVYVQRADGSWLKKASTTMTSHLTGKLKLKKTYTFSVKSYKYVNGNKVYGKAKTASVRASKSAYGKTPSGTWVEVCTETQKMYMYVDNKLYVVTDVVTGMAGGALATTHGYHTVLNKKSPAVLKGSYGSSSWTTPVSYWIAFTSDGQGIHDSTWRGAYGGNIYLHDGSHGCVNTPISAVKKIYSKAYVGMPVIVF
ncbi:MAG: L,D-transpeptidase family protein [Ruminococcus sp.]|nr:L,D-transpeptidase family protein [Ruminococcus sp.]